MSNKPLLLSVYNGDRSRDIAPRLRFLDPHGRQVEVTAEQASHLAWIGLLDTFDRRAIAARLSTWRRMTASVAASNARTQGGQR